MRPHTREMLSSADASYAPGSFPTAFQQLVQSPTLLNRQAVSTPFVL